MILVTYFQGVCVLFRIIVVSSRNTSKRNQSIDRVQSTMAVYHQSTRNARSNCPVSSECRVMIVAGQANATRVYWS